MNIKHKQIEKKIRKILFEKTLKLAKTKTPFLIILTGESAVGKTTLVRKMINEIQFVRIQNDELRVLTFGSPKLDKKEDDFFFETVNNIVLEILAKGYHVLWDARFPDPRIRQEKYKKIISNGFGFLCIYVYLKESIRRQRQLERDIERRTKGDKSYFYNTNLEALREKNHREYDKPLIKEKYVIKFCNNKSPINQKDFNKLMQDINKKINNLFIKNKIVVDMGASFTKIGYSNDNISIKDLVVKKTIDFANNPKSFYKNLSDLLYNKWSIDLKEVSEVNIALHGVVKNNILVKSTRLPSFINFDFNNFFCNQKWYLCNDACAAALGSYITFKNKIKFPTAVLTLGTGVGLSIIKNDSIIESNEKITNKQQFILSNNEGRINMHGYIGLKGREKIGISNYTEKVFRVLEVIKNKANISIKSFIILGGASNLINVELLENLKRVSPKIKNCQFVIDKLNSNRIVLNGLLFLNSNKNIPKIKNEKSY